MANALAKASWKVAGLAFAIPAGKAARKAMDTTWKSLRGTDPPSNPAAHGTTWGEAVLWSAVIGAASGMARLVAARGAAAAWQTLTGSLPPGLEDSTL